MAYLQSSAWTVFYVGTAFVQLRIAPQNPKTPFIEITIVRQISFIMN